MIHPILKKGLPKLSFPAPKASMPTLWGMGEGFNEVARSAELTDKDIKGKLWWSKKRGGIGGGVHINDALPINPAPLIGGQNWYDNICSVEKI